MNALQQVGMRVERRRLHRHRSRLILSMNRKLSLRSSLRNMLRRRACLDHSRHHLARAPASPSGRSEGLLFVKLLCFKRTCSILAIAATALPNMGRCLLLLALLSGWLIATEQSHAPRDSHNDEDLVPGTNITG
jgi:hypothetical protein